MVTRAEGKTSIPRCRICTLCRTGSRVPVKTFLGSHLRPTGLPVLKRKGKRTVVSYIVCLFPEVISDPNWVRAPERKIPPAWAWSACKG